jgi:hypothetical protein
MSIVATPKRTAANNRGRHMGVTGPPVGKVWSVTAIAMGSGIHAQVNSQ